METFSLKSLEQLQLLETAKIELLERWISVSVVQTTLQKYGITTRFFGQYFGSKVIDYAFGVIAGKNRLGNCPVIGVMLVFFEKKNFSLGDVFTICVNFKNAMIEHALEKGVLNSNLLQDICTLIDTNFLGVIREYLELHYSAHLSEHNSCSLEDKPFTPVPAATYCATMAHVPSLKTNQASAFIYMQEVDIDMDVIQELAEIEEETLALFDLSGSFSYEAHREVIGLFTQYAKMIDQLIEFQEISYTLWVLIALLQDTDISSLGEEATYVSIYTKAIINDLSAWRRSIFVDISAADIHYLDKTLLSSIAQLQIMLSGSEGSSVDEIEFF